MNKTWWKKSFLRKISLGRLLKQYVSKYWFICKMFKKWKKCVSTLWRKKCINMWKKCKQVCKTLLNREIIAPQCRNYRRSLSRFLSKISWKQREKRRLRQKWFHESFFVSEFLVFPHCVPTIPFLLFLFYQAEDHVKTTQDMAVQNIFRQMCFDSQGKQQK